MAVVRVRQTLLLLMVSLQVLSLTHGAVALRVGFYNRECPAAEATVRRIVRGTFNRDRTITAALLRLYFHDCFVRGCDASLLLKSTGGAPAERDAGANLTVRGYELIDEAKAAVDRLPNCRGKVSCADIIALATRDAVGMSGGPRFDMPTGRRDGRVSLASEVNLPGPTLNMEAATQSFVDKGLTQSDMVILLGAHTVGITHCAFFSNRLWNFQGTGAADPAMDPALVEKLKRVCPEGGVGLGNEADLDQATPAIVDRRFFSEMVAGRGVLALDQALAIDRATSGQTNLLAGLRSPFTADFVAALIKLGNVGVLEGIQGEIRNICSRIN